VASAAERSLIAPHPHCYGGRCQPSGHVCFSSPPSSLQQARRGEHYYHPSTSVRGMMRFGLSSIISQLSLSLCGACCERFLAGGKIYCHLIGRAKDKGLGGVPAFRVLLRMELDLAVHNTRFSLSNLCLRSKSIKSFRPL
jgi:hypothetical protein